MVPGMSYSLGAGFCGSVSVKSFSPISGVEGMRDGRVYSAGPVVENTQHVNSIAMQSGHTLSVLYTYPVKHTIRP